MIGKLQEKTRPTTEPSQDDDLIRVTIDDDIILQTDDAGESVVRLSVKIGDKEILAKFPNYGDYTAFTKKVVSILSKMSDIAPNLEIPDLTKQVQGKDDFRVWSAIMQAVVRPTSIRDTIEHTFFKYLQPTVNGKKISKRWARKNISVDAIFKFFTAILLVDRFIKKNAQLILNQIVQAEISPQSLPQSEKNMGGTPTNSTKNPSSKYASF